MNQTMIYQPFGCDVPSDVTAREAFTDGRAPAGGAMGVRKAPIGTGGGGWTERPDEGRASSETPEMTIGEPWIMVVFLFFYGGYLALSRRWHARKSALVGVLLLCLVPEVTAGISDLLIDPDVTGGAEVTVTPDFSTGLTGKNVICWGLYYDEACTRQVPDISFTPGDGYAVSFTAPTAAGTYYVKSTLRPKSCYRVATSTRSAALRVYPDDADLVLVREAQGMGEYVNLTSGSPAKAYGVLLFDKRTILDDDISEYRRFNYFISFPFDVQMADVSGFGTVGWDWRILYYDGLTRAREGYFAEKTDNWVMIDDTDSVLHAGQGYLLQLNTISMADEELWGDKEQLSLIFPALNSISSIASGSATSPALGPAYQCTIDYSELLGDDGDRQAKDSYWRCIGVPSLTTPAGVSGLTYFYEWDMDENSLSVHSSAGFVFDPMHAYLVQNGNELTWSSVSRPVSAAAARMRGTDAPEECAFVLKRDEQIVDRTYVRLTDDATEAFDFGMDLIKEQNSRKANLYTLAENERVAGNCLPAGAERTVVPVGLTVPEAGVYTVSMSQYDGDKRVTLVDVQRGERIDMQAGDYMMALEAGVYEGRFVLEWTPWYTATDLPETTNEHEPNKVQKLLINGHLFIRRGNKLFSIL